MERFRHKRSKSAGGADRTSPLGFGFPNAAPPQQGNKQSHKQKGASKFASDPNAYRSSGLPVQGHADPLMYDLGRYSAKRVYQTPIKKLLAEEMVRETEPKRRSPSIIARLMGLDGLPTQKPALKQQKGFPMESQQRIVPLESHRKAISYESDHRRKNTKEHQEFKDVFEVIETPKVDRRVLASQKTESAGSTEPKIEFIWQKFMDAKRLSTNETLQDSKEFHDALEVLDSNKDLLLKFLQEPDSLSSKHLHDLKGIPPEPRASNITVMRSGNALKYEKMMKESRSGRQNLMGDSRTSQRRPDGLVRQPNSYSKHDIHDHVKSKQQSEGNGPTRIVVLKPNIVKLKDASESVLSPRSSASFHSDCSQHMEFSSGRHREADSRGKENLSSSLRPSRQKFRESRGASKKVSGTIRNGYGNMSPSYGRGYAGDESSSSMSENEFANESNGATSTSRSFIDFEKHYGHSSHSTESAVTREAKKRLSERWKMTRRFLDIGVLNRGSTLGEMLSNTDRQMHKDSPDSNRGTMNPKRNGKAVGLVDPLGISSRDGWKDGCISNMSRSRSVPASSSGTFESPRAVMMWESNEESPRMMPKVSSDQNRSKTVQKNLNQKGNVTYRNPRSGYKKSRSTHSSSRVRGGNLIYVNYSQNGVHDNFVRKDSAEEIPVFPETSATMVTDASSDSADAGCVTSSISSHSSTFQDAADCVIVKAESSLYIKDTSLPQDQSALQCEQDLVVTHCAVPEPESPASSKEIDQPSPVSVLEVSFAEDPSSACDSFERVSADIQGLRMQLQLLKLESDSYGEGPMHISSDEDENSGEKGKGTQESWQSSYLVDVLNHCSFGNPNLDMFMAACDYSECPIGPWVFEELERKYSDQNTSCLRCDRKLLFDRICSGLAEIEELFMDLHPWVKPSSRMMYPKWDRVEVEAELHKLLVNQEKQQASDVDIAEMVMGKKSQWLHLGDDTDIIVKEVERLLIDELVTGTISYM